MIRDLPLSVFGDRVRGYWARTLSCTPPSLRPTRNQDVIVADTSFDQLQKINTWWDVQGQYPTDNESVVLGKTALMNWVRWLATGSC